MKKLLLFASVLCGLTVAAGNQVKVIDLSWSNPTVDFLQRNLAAMEKDSPLDGLCIRVRGDRVTRNGRKYFAADCAWTNTKLEFKNFAKDVAALKKIPFKKFTDNFYYSTTYYYDLDWHDDAGWKTATDNFGVIARVCREAGLKGILFDLEEYRKEFWDYWKFINPAKDYKTTAATVYKRGQQWGKAVFGNYPEITLFMPYMFSMYDRSLGAYFINGIISVMPPAARIIEGYEPDSYDAKKPEDYRTIAAKFYKNAKRCSSPENRAKYMAQVELAPGFYMDAIIKKKKFEELKKQCGGVNNFMRRNIAGALEETRSYIWLYSEAGCWWKKSVHPQAKKTWDEMAPGIGKTIRENVSPVIVASSENLLKDPDMKGNGGWNPWQLENKKKGYHTGTIKIGGGKAVFKNVQRGCIAQTVNVKPGDYYRFQFRGVNSSRGSAGGSIAFRDKDGKWLDVIYNYPVPMPDTGKFENVSHLVTVPPGAYKMSVQLSGSNQGVGDTGEVVFTGAQLIKY